jgi:hypothetical protein
MTKYNVLPKYQRIYKKIIFVRILRLTTYDNQIYFINLDPQRVGSYERRSPHEAGLPDEKSVIAHKREMMSEMISFFVFIIADPLSAVRTAKPSRNFINFTARVFLFDEAFGAVE